MSLVAPRTITPSAEDVPDVNDGGEKVTAGVFWPEIVLSDARKEMRITGTVTTSRLKHVVIEAVGHTADQLDTWRIEQQNAGFASLDTVPAMAEREGLPLAPRGLQHSPRPADRNVP